MGHTVLSGRVGRRTGGWNGRYRAVHRIDFSALRRPGTYRIVVGGLAAASPGFRVATRHALFQQLVDDTVRFFQVQREGARACPVDGRNRFAAFDRPDARFLDDVHAWPSVEPAIDFTSTGMLAFALAASR